MNDHAASPWDLLAIAPDADVRTIKSAYARQLKAIGGSADTARFQTLHEAFQAALAWARIREQPGEGAEPVRSRASAADLSAEPEPAAHRSVIDESDAAFDPAPVPVVRIGDPPWADPELPRPVHARSITHPTAIAQALLAELAPLEAEAQSECLWQEPALQSLQGRPQVELEFLRMLDPADLTHLAVLPALRAFFGWQMPPLGVEDERCRRLLRWWEADPPVLLVLELFDRLSYLPRLLDRLEWLALDPLHQQLSRPLPIAVMEVPLARQLLAQPARYARHAWTLIDHFNWRRPAASEATDTEALQDMTVLRRALFDPAGPAWPHLRAATVEEVLQELRDAYDLGDCRKRVAHDRRLTSVHWGAALLEPLRTYVEAHPGTMESRALLPFLRAPVTRKREALRQGRNAAEWAWLQWILVMVAIRVLAEWLG